MPLTHLYIILFQITLSFNTQLPPNIKSLSFPINTTNTRPLITLQIGSPPSPLPFHLDINSEQNIITTVFSLSDTSKSYKRLSKDITKVYFNTNQAYGYLSSDIITINSEQNKYCSFPNFFICDNCSHNILSLSRSTMNNDYSLLYQLYTKGYISSLSFTLDFLHNQLIYGKNEKHFFTKQHKAHIISCYERDYDRSNWNIKLQSMYLTSNSQLMEVNMFFTFDLGRDVTIVPYALFKTIVNDLFTNVQQCKEIDAAGIYYVKCDEIPNSVNNIDLILYFEGFHMVIPVQHMFDNSFIFMIIARNDNSNNNNNEHSLGFHVLKQLAIAFDYDKNEMRFYNDDILHNNSIILPIDNQILILLIIICIMFIIVLCVLCIRRYKLKRKIRVMDKKYYSLSKHMKH